MIFNFKTEETVFQKVFQKLPQSDRVIQKVTLNQISVKKKTSKFKTKRFSKCKTNCWKCWFLRDYSSSLSEAKYKATHGKRLKILTSKQMLQTTNSSCLNKSK